VLPLVVLLLKGPIQLIMHRRQKRRHSDDEEEGILNIIIEACIELMETLTGYISGTVSFVRVGAFAISHAALCFAIYSIVGVLKSMRIEGALGGVLSIVIIIFGNIIVIAFEGMVAMIQGIRLEYYELFSKYFSGDGIAYEPFQIDEKNDASSTEPTPPA
jgi:V/A-type H+-transporting ATPase subunit I